MKNYNNILTRGKKSKISRDEIKRRLDNITFMICMLGFLIWDIQALVGWGNIYDGIVGKIETETKYADASAIVATQIEQTIPLTSLASIIIDNTIDFKNHIIEEVEAIVPKYEEKVYEVTADILNVRKTPEGEVIKQYVKGTQLRATNQLLNDEWYLGPEGYISAKFLIEPEKVLIAKDKNLYIPKPVISKVITKKSNLNLLQINKLIANTGYANQGQAILDAENNYGVNAFLTIAIANHESYFGKSQLARYNNNLFGFMNNGKPYSFSNMGESIEIFAKNIRKYYFNRGLDTVDKIAYVYCTENTDEWLKGVPSFIDANYKKIVNNQ